MVNGNQGIKTEQCMRQCSRRVTTPEDDSGTLPFSLSQLVARMRTETAKETGEERERRRKADEKENKKEGKKRNKRD